jgi:predicted enzyme related to lactoylglutathione lyase
MKIHPDQLCQIEISVASLDKAINFYRHVFGWEPVPAYIHDYVVLKVPDNCPFGISLVPAREVSGPAANGITLYFKVASPDEIINVALLHGGKKLPSRRLPGYGKIAQFADPDGQIFGLFSSESP